MTVLSNAARCKERQIASETILKWLEALNSEQDHYQVRRCLAYVIQNVGKYRDSCIEERLKWLEEYACSEKEE